MEGSHCVSVLQHILLSVLERSHCMLGNLTVVPIKVPQVSSLHRLSGQTSTVLPQSLSPAQTQSLSLAQTQSLSPAQTQSLSPAQTQSLSPAQAQSLSPALAWPGGISPTSTSSSSPTATSASVAPGVTFSIISASPPADTGNNRVWTISEAVKVHPLIFNTDNKVKDCPTHPSLYRLCLPACLSHLNLNLCNISLCSSTMAEIQTKRQERKRRSTANPAYSGLVQPERKRLASNYLNDPLFLSVRGKTHVYQPIKLPERPTLPVSER
uniref:Uncharacterized protein n=1 Tax=Oncorhynchus tshawytscha TaxID=74940 RepID=A0AAZ3QTK8_ONCTS